MTDIPTDEMIEAGAKALGEYGFSHLNDEEYRLIYLAMRATDPLLKECVEALEGLVQAVQMDAHANNGISGYTGARLTDARATLAAMTKGEE